MELIKNLIKYFLILLIIVVLAGALMAGVMFVFPSVSLFGFRYVSSHSEYGFISDVGNSITKINVETDNYDIIVRPYRSSKSEPTTTKICISVVSSLTGYSRNGINETQVKKVGTEEYKSVSLLENDPKLIQNEDGTEFTIVLNEPTGVVAYGNSKVIISVPEVSQNVQYNLKTNNGAISFEKNSENEEQMISASNVDVTVSSIRGSLNLNNLSMADGSDLFINNYIGRVKVDSTKLGNVTINSNSGNFEFAQIGYEGPSNVGKLTVKGNNPYVKVGTVYGAVNYGKDGAVTTGYLEIGTLKKEIIYNSINGILKIDKALSTIEATTESGEITIGQIGEKGDNFQVDINSKSGKVTLGGENKNVYCLSKVLTESGRVVVNNFSEENHDCEIETTSGSIEVTFEKSDAIKNLIAKTSSGAITLNNICGEVSATTGNNSKIYANFYKVSKKANFNTSNGEVEIVLPVPTNTNIYQLNLKNKQNNLNVDIAGYEKTSFDGEKVDEYYQFSKVFPDGKTGANEICVTTSSGRISVHE